MTRSEMNPDDVQAEALDVTVRANDAVAALGPRAGHPPQEIELALDAELKARGIDWPHETLAAAAEVLAAGQPFLFD